MFEAARVQSLLVARALAWCASGRDRSRGYRLPTCCNCALIRKTPVMGQRCRRRIAVRTAGVRSEPPSRSPGRLSERVRGTLQDSRFAPPGMACINPAPMQVATIASTPRAEASTPTARPKACDQESVSRTAVKTWPDVVRSTHRVGDRFRMDRMEPRMNADWSTLHDPRFPR